MPQSKKRAAAAAAPAPAPADDGSPDAPDAPDAPAAPPPRKQVRISVNRVLSGPGGEWDLVRVTPCQSCVRRMSLAAKGPGAICCSQSSAGSKNCAGCAKARQTCRPIPSGAVIPARRFVEHVKSLLTLPDKSADAEKYEELHQAALRSLSEEKAMVPAAPAPAAAMSDHVLADLLRDVIARQDETNRLLSQLVRSGAATAKQTAASLKLAAATVTTVAAINTKVGTIATGMEHWMASNEEEEKQQQQEKDKEQEEEQDEEEENEDEVEYEDEEEEE